ncbi:MAG: carboxypeptidase-like regulatory domain-containing protein [Planctomycetota bacterium]
MIFAKLLVAACSLVSDPAARAEGSISGTVVNGSRGYAPAAGAEVVLRVKVDGQFVIAAETVADGEGRFRIAPLPVNTDLEYLPGANRDGVHHPGDRVRLTWLRPHADVRITTYDAVEGPNPLVARRHDIVVRPEPGALKVTETITIDNPTSTCYVGKPAGEGTEPVTLELAIPPDFDRTTFHKEFFGRRFLLAGEKLATGVPWPPGEKELTFTYLLRSEERHRLWRRPLDLPTDHVRLFVVTDEPGEVVCSLGPGSDQGRGEGELLFESDGKTFPAGHVLRLELGRLPVPWMAYGRWLALVVLAGLVAGIGLMTLRRKSVQARQARPAAQPSEPVGPQESTTRRDAAHARRRRKRKRSARRPG